MKKIFTLIALLNLCSLLPAAAQSTADNGQHLIDKFFEIFESKGHEPALKYAFGTNKWMSANSDAIQNVIFELNKSVNLIGNYIDKEEIKSKNVGSRFRIASYFVYYDRQPLRFTFQLYKNKEGWLIWNFKFDSQFGEEIEEAMMLYRFRELSDWN